jgi:hypothetical protein
MNRKILFSRTLYSVVCLIIGMFSLPSFYEPRDQDLNLDKVLAPINVEVAVDWLRATKVSDGPGIADDRDEVYILFRYRGVSLPVYSGHSTNVGQDETRLPRYVDGDDYYQVFANQSLESELSWTNQDGAPAGSPVLWRGGLRPREEVYFDVYVGDQDHKPASLTGPNELVLSTQSTALPEQYRPHFEVIRKLGAIGEYGDAYGKYGLHVKHIDGGRIQTDWIPINFESFHTGKAGTTFTGSTDKAKTLFATINNPASVRFSMDQNTGGAKAQLRATVRIIDDAPGKAGVYIGSEEDKCSANKSLVVHGTTDVAIKAGETKKVRISNKLFYWDCGGSSGDHSDARPGTTYMMVKRARSNRDIKWFCFKEKSF